MILYLARHGQTNYNVNELCNADPSIDVHLTELGVKQAQKLGADLKGVKFDAVFVSNLKRTTETASYINKFHNVPLQVDTRLRDNDTGFEGQWSGLWLQALEESGYDWSARFNGAESMMDVLERLRAFLDDLRKQAYETVLIVAHGTPIMLLINELLGKPQSGVPNWKTVPQGEFIRLEI